MNLSLQALPAKLSAASLLDVISQGESAFIEFKSSFQKEVIETFIAYGLPEPEFEATQGGMAVTVFNAVNVGVNVGVNSLLAYIQANPGQRAGEMAGTFTVTQRTIERWLKQLKEDGLIEFRGAAKTGGYYYKNI